MWFSGMTSDLCLSCPQFMTTHHGMLLVDGAVVEYIKYMGGVDHGYQLLTYYGYSHRSRKWWRRAFFLFDKQLHTVPQQQQDRGGRCRVELANIATATALSVTPASHGNILYTSKTGL